MNEAKIIEYLAKFDKNVAEQYNELIDELAIVGMSIDDIPEGELFTFDKYPATAERVAKSLEQYQATMTQNLVNAMQTAITISFAAAPRTVNGYTVWEEAAINQLRDDVSKAWVTARMAPKKGLSLSQRVWNYSQQTKAEFEMAMSDILTDGLQQGTSAETIARRVKGMLNNPDAVYRRYHLKKTMADGTKKDIVQWRRKTVDADGKVHFMSTDIEHPGMGVYRSSRQNALRMAATEINTAYRFADCTRWKNEPFVTGIRIELSDNHPIYDMCDELAGVYPKTFMFKGWHPRCRCTVTSVIMDDEEFEKYMAMPQEERDKYVSPNLTTEMPKGYEEYIKANEKRIMRSVERGTEPWWIADNYIDSDIHKPMVVGSSYYAGSKTPKGIAPTGTTGSGVQLSDMKVVSQTTRPDGAILTPQQLFKVMQEDRALYSQSLLDNMDELEQLLGLPRGTSMSWELANKGAENPLFNRGGVYHTNCQTATVVHELRRRGFNITAKGSNVFDSLIWNGKPFDWEERFLNADGTRVQVEKVKDWATRKGYNKISSQKLSEYFEEKTLTDGRYEVYIEWEPAKKIAGYDRQYGSHVIMAERKNGVLTFFDPQTGKSGDDIDWYFKLMRNKEVHVMRIDDKIIHPAMASTLNAQAGIVNTKDFIMPKAKSPIELAAEARHAKRKDAVIQRLADIRGAMTDEQRQIYHMLNGVAKTEGIDKIGYDELFRTATIDADGKIISVRISRSGLDSKLVDALDRYEKTMQSLSKFDTASVGLKRGKILADYIEQQKLKAISSIARGSGYYKNIPHYVSKRYKELIAERDALRQQWEATRVTRNAGVVEPKKSILDAHSYQDLVDILGDDMPPILSEYEQSILRESWTDPRYIAEKAEIEAKLKDFFENVITGYGHFTDIDNIILDDHILSGYGIWNTQIEVEKRVRSRSDSYHKGRCGWAEFAYKPVSVRSRKETWDWKPGEYYRCAAPLETNDPTHWYVEQNSGYGGYAGTNAMIKFRNDKVVTTFTLDNSLGSDQIASLTCDPKIVSLDRHTLRNMSAKKFTSVKQIKGSTGNYLEAQVFSLKNRNGVLGAEEIESIILPEHPSRISGASKGVWDKWYEAHVDIYYYDSSDGKVKLYRAGKPLETEAERKARIEARNKKRISDRNKALAKQGLTPEERIKQLQKDRAAQIVDARNNAQSLIDVADSVENADISLDEVKRLFNKGNYFGARNKAEEIRQKIADLKVRRDALKDIIPDADDWHKKFTIDELEEAHKNIKKKIGYFESKYSSDLDKQLQKFIDERDYTKDPTKFSWGVGKTPHKTWEIAYNAYQRKVVEIEFTIKKNQALTALAEVETYNTTNATFNGFISKAKSLIGTGNLDDALAEIAKANSFKENYDKIVTALADLKTFSTKAKAFNENIANAEALLNAGDYSGSMAEINKALAKRKQLENYRRYAQKGRSKDTPILETILKKGESADHIFDSEEFTQAKKDAAKWFRAADPKSYAQIDQAFRDADKYMSQYAEDMWKNLTKEEKMVLWLYTDGSKYINDEMLQYFGKGSYCNKLVSVIDGTVRNGLEDGNLLTSIIEKAPALKEGVWMQSGKSLGAMEGIFGVRLNSKTDLSSLVGKEGSSEIFMSCHSARDGAFTKHMSTGSTNEVVLTIYMPKGTKGVYMEPFASFGDESSALKRGKKGFEWNGKYTGEEPSNQVEFVLQRGSKFRITKAVKGDDGKWYIDVDVIEQSAQKAMNTNIPGFDNRWNVREYRANERAGVRQYE